MFDYAEAERVIEMAKQKIDADLIIVFGSVAKGTADDDSDIDIIFVKETNENSFLCSAKARIALEDSKIPIDIIAYTPKDFKRDLSDRFSLASEAVATGRIIHGSV